MLKIRILIWSVDDCIMFRRITLTAICFLAVLPVHSDAFEQAERNRQMKIARESGFASTEIDLLHFEIGKLTAELYSFQNLPEIEQLNQLRLKDRLDSPVDDRLVAGPENSYIRFKIRQGISLSTDVYPNENMYSSHCYVIQKPDQLFPEQIIFQSYRIYHDGTQYMRELRRLVHRPQKPEQNDENNSIEIEGPEVSAEEKVDVVSKPASNAQLTVEYFSQPATQEPVPWLQSDGVARPDIQAKPTRLLKPFQPEKEIRYSRQLTVMRTYRDMLKQLVSHLRHLVHNENLERSIMIDRMIDFTGNNY